MDRQSPSCFRLSRRGLLEGYRDQRLLAKPRMSSLSQSYDTNEGDNMKNIDIAVIPELKTSVGIHGSAKRKEVGGPVCLGILLGVAIYSSGPRKV